MGTGSAIAHRAVDAVVGPRTIHHEHGGAPEAAPAAPVACSNQTKAFEQCLDSSNGDIASCQVRCDAQSARGAASLDTLQSTQLVAAQFYFDALKNCKSGYN